MIRKSIEQPPLSIYGGGGLYLHIPFCGSICSYCHFNRTGIHSIELREKFTDYILKELEMRAAGQTLKSVYIGGGTPSQLETTSFSAIIKNINSLYNINEDTEITSEANPETFSNEMAKAWRSLGINRISLGIQSLDNDVLKVLGRNCNAEVAEKALDIATKYFDNVSADWILAPACSIDQFRNDFNLASDLGVKHISFYILELHEGTEIYNKIQNGSMASPDDDETRQLYKSAVEVLTEFGYKQYEISNFSKLGFESRHNSAYWNRETYIGVGPGASGFDGVRRYQNSSNLDQWFGALDNDELPEKSVDVLDETAVNLEKLFLGLRTCKGIPVGMIGSDSVIEIGQNEKLWEIIDNRLRLTLDGMLRIDDIEELLMNQIVNREG